MSSYNETSIEEMTEILKGYIDSDYWDLNDWETIIKRAKIIKERNIVEFRMSFMNLYLDTRDLSFVDVHPYFQ